MISKEHKKHTALTRPAFGVFARNEWAIIGAPCPVIKKMAGEIIKSLSNGHQCAYVDTTHSDETVSMPGRLANGAYLEYTDEINYRQLNYSTGFNQFKLRETFAGTDLVLVNGNHHQAKKQVVIISESKKTSLRKRLHQLTDVQLFLFEDGAADVFDFVKEALPGWQEIPIYPIGEIEKIVAFFEKQMQLAKPVLNGLVLAGGKSERMGFDKGAVNWYGKEQRYHVADLLKPFCREVFISCRNDQESLIDHNYKPLGDTFTGLGPYGAILSAFREKPDSAWLVIACDLPLMDAETLEYLTANRNSASIATTFQSGFDGFPEPLITIWEPKSYPVLLSFLAQGYSCPRKVLINSETCILQAPRIEALTNVNTPEDYQKIKNLLPIKLQAHEA